MHWRIADAATGRVAEGHVRVADLLDIQPWGDAEGGPVLDVGTVLDVGAGATAAP